MVKTYLDLDGVMADFDSYFMKLFKLNHKIMLDTEMWNHIKNYGTFFEELPIFEEALQFFQQIKDLNPIILTACPKTNYFEAATQKRKWVYKHLSPDTMVIPMLGGANKALFMHSPGDILIDDFKKNCVAWEALGGIAIYHENFTETKKQLWKAI